MNIDFNLNTFLNIVENIFSNDIITYIIPKKDNFNTFGKILPIFDESRNYSEELVQDLLEYKILNNNEFNSTLNNEFNSVLNNEFNSVLNNEFNSALNNEFNSALNNEFNSALNNEFNSTLNNENDKYKFKYDIENGLYDIEIGYISLMENSFNNNNNNNNKDKEICFNNSINEMNSISGNYDNTYVIDCFDNEDI